MLRFDPATGKGEVWTPESAADKIVVYRYR
jgi:hypothetical protein